MGKSRLPAVWGCSTLGRLVELFGKFVEKMGEAPMDEKLVAACQMFLVPAAILFAAQSAQLGCTDFIGGQGYLTPTETPPLRWPTFSLPLPSSRPLFIFGCGARNGRTAFSIHCSRTRAWSSSG